MHFRYNILTLGCAVAGLAFFASGAAKAFENQHFNCGGKTAPVLWMGSEQVPCNLAGSAMTAPVENMGDGDAHLWLISDRPIPVDSDGGIGDGRKPIRKKPMPIEGNGGIGDGAGPIPGLPMPVDSDGGIGDGAGPIPDLPMPVDSDGGIGDGAGPIPDLPMPVDSDGGIGDGRKPIHKRPIPVEQDGGIGGGVNTVLNISGRSLGGRLREGPGTGFHAIGSLRKGTRIKIIANTGVSSNGYDWFEIRLRNGKRAYQWGGIMCSKGKRVSGIYARCR